MLSLGWDQDVMTLQKVEQDETAALYKQYHIIDYNDFVRKIWPKMAKGHQANQNKKYQLKYHPSLVYTEIISYIKGLRQSLDSPNGYLSEEDYLNIGSKLSPMFDANDRKDIYGLFKLYEKEKKALGRIDKLDVVYSIYGNIMREGYNGDAIHMITVDEVQDLTQAELWLFFLICKTPGGFFFAGDTAQTIERGVGFRFCDLHSLFHMEKQLRDKPEIFQLTNNYRSHSGILNLACSVVELIEYFFPLTIDRLKKDRGSHFCMKCMFNLI